MPVRFVHCNNCNGTGEVTDYNKSTHSGNYVTYGKKICSFCTGTGKVEQYYDEPKKSASASRSQRASGRSSPSPKPNPKSSKKSSGSSSVFGFLIIVAVIFGIYQFTNDGGNGASGGFSLDEAVTNVQGTEIEESTSSTNRYTTMSWSELDRISDNYKGKPDPSVMPDEVKIVRVTYTFYAEISKCFDELFAKRSDLKGILWTKPELVEYFDYRIYVLDKCWQRANDQFKPQGVNAQNYLYSNYRNAFSELRRGTIQYKEFIEKNVPESATAGRISDEIQNYKTTIGDRFIRDSDPRNWN